MVNQDRRVIDGSRHIHAEYVERITQVPGLRCLLMIDPDAGLLIAADHVRAQKKRPGDALN